ncbi:MAG: ABC transporter ATP-binding protein [Hyphomicrobiaceae bacterium]|nr:MAG: ABC transporter ATP-binding protein [Hyphomicrobiaceae bacterium]
MSHFSNTPAAHPNLLVAVRGVQKVLGAGASQVMALKGVDLDLMAGELTLLMGPSGSGKTTLLSILGCILTPTEGELYIAGSSTGGLSSDGLAHLRRTTVGLVFQSYNLFPTLTATENIMLALDVRGKKRSTRAIADAALAEVGLSHRRNAYPGQMSGGEKQRVAIARALAGKPAVILADEPTAALDGENGRAVMELLAQAAKDPSRTVLAVTHDHRTLRYADRIIRIEDGRLVGEERVDKSAPHQQASFTSLQLGQMKAPVEEPNSGQHESRSNRRSRRRGLRKGGHGQDIPPEQGTRRET